MRADGDGAGHARADLGAAEVRKCAVGGARGERAQRVEVLEAIFGENDRVAAANRSDFAAAGVRVVIESQDENDVWGTVGVSENIITASLKALADSMEYALMKK